MVRSVNKQTSREKILDQGVSLLMEQGYHGTGLQEILDAVRIPKGSFYNYFDSKERFGAEVVQRYIEPFLQQLDDHMRNPTGDALSGLTRYFDELIDELEKRQFKGGCLLGNLIGEIGDTSDVCMQSLRRAVRCYRDALQAGIARAQAEGSLRADLTAGTMANLLVNLWQGALLRMKIEQSVEPLKECCRSLLNDYFKA